MARVVARKAKLTAFSSPISAAWSSAEDLQEVESLSHVPQLVARVSIYVCVCVVLAYQT